MSSRLFPDLIRRLFDLNQDRFWKAPNNLLTKNTLRQMVAFVPPPHCFTFLTDNHSSPARRQPLNPKPHLLRGCEARSSNLPRAWQRAELQRGRCCDARGMGKVRRGRRGARLLSCSSCSCQGWGRSRLHFKRMENCRGRQGGADGSGWCGRCGGC
jgi:hypothetical protein